MKSSASNLAEYWLGETSSALKRESAFRKEGLELVKLFEAGTAAENQFNILYSNTETLSPALYNSVPRPVIQRRFKDEDPLGKLAAKAGTRTLEYLIDDGASQYATFDELMKAAVLEALVPGRGHVRFRYDAVIEKVRNLQAAEAAEEAEQVQDPSEEAEQEGHIPADPEKVSYETVCGEEVPWDRFLHGYAKKWKDVPWISYYHLMTKEELEENFGTIGALVEVAVIGKDNEDGSDSGKQEGSGGVKVAEVYEIWDKRTRRVLFVSPNYKEAPLKVVEDPLKLSGFFDCPKPLTFHQKISGLIPTPLYAQYKEQAKELNRITARINKIVAALKIRGMYDSTVEGLDKVLESEDNVLLPAQNVAALGQNGKLENALWLVPIEKLVAVLQQLYVQRQQVKQVIYEITGIADIMRGATQASETLGAQELKNQWGTLRLKRLQKEVARFARDSLRIMLEIAVSKLSPETLQAMTGLPFPTGAQKQQVAAQIQQAAAFGQPVPPDMQALSQGPSWDDILGLLQDDLQRNYRIDIETNSTVDAEATEDKQNIAELLNAISQFLNGVAPLVESGSMPFDIAQSMLLAVVRRFRFGPELEDQLKGMKPPPPKPDPKAEADKQRLAMEMQQSQREAAQREKEMVLELRIKEREAALRLKEMERKEQLAEALHRRKMEQMLMQASMPPKPAGNTTA